MQLMWLANNHEYIAGSEPELGARDGDLFVSSHHRQHQRTRLAAQARGREALAGQGRLGSEPHPLDRHLRDAGDGVEAQTPAASLRSTS